MMSTRRSRQRRAAAALVMTASLGLCGAAQTAMQGPESWYDAGHGWRAVGLQAIFESNDGGATWHKLPNPQDSQPATVLRTGLKVGLQVNATTDRTLWTNDSGRHWSYAPQIGAPATGADAFLFWAKGRAVYRVTPWPPPYACTRVLRGNRCGYVDGRGRVREARLTATRVGTVPEGALAASVLPGGVVAAAFATGPSARPYVLLARYPRRLGAPRVRVQELPHPADPTLTACAAPLVDWPRIAIAACRFGDDSAGAVGFWLSLDGGSSWNLAGVTAAEASGWISRGLRTPR